MAELNQATTQMDDLTRLAAVLGSMPIPEQRAMIQKWMDEANGALRILNARSS